MTARNPTTFLVGAGPVATALAGGLVAVLQPHAKKLLAASTSAHHGLLLVATGAGYPAVAIAHLITHAFFQLLLFIAAGIAAVSPSGWGRRVQVRPGRLSMTVPEPKLMPSSSFTRMRVLDRSAVDSASVPVAVSAVVSGTDCCGSPRLLPRTTVSSLNGSLG